MPRRRTGSATVIVVREPMSVAFLVTSLIIVATPGVGVLFTLSEALARGVRAGVVAAFGCTLGILPHLVAATTGTAALLRASGAAFETVKVAGVAYLLYLAVATWRDRSEVAIERPPPRSARRVVVSAVLANLLNPKLTIFFFAFLPQFVRRGSSHELAAVLLLSAVFMLMTFVVFVLYGILAATVRERVVDRPRLVIRVRRLFAASFFALGAKLAVTARS
jgi:threonine/homoserine/homoserine lactone efflux protein